MKKKAKQRPKQQPKQKQTQQPKQQTAGKVPVLRYPQKNYAQYNWVPAKLNDVAEGAYAFSGPLVCCLWHETRETKGRAEAQVVKMKIKKEKKEEEGEQEQQAHLKRGLKAAEGEEKTSNTRGNASRQQSPDADADAAPKAASKPAAEMTSSAQVPNGGKQAAESRPEADSSPQTSSADDGGDGSKSKVKSVKLAAAQASVLPQADRCNSSVSVAIGSATDEAGRGESAPFLEQTESSCGGKRAADCSADNAMVVVGVAGQELLDDLLLAQSQATAATLEELQSTQKTEMESEQRVPKKQGAQWVLGSQVSEYDNSGLQAEPQSSNNSSSSTGTSLLDQVKSLLKKNPNLTVVDGLREQFERWEQASRPPLQASAEHLASSAALVKQKIDATCQQVLTEAKEALAQEQGALAGLERARAQSVQTLAGLLAALGAAKATAEGGAIRVGRRVKVVTDGASAVIHATVDDLAERLAEVKGQVAAEKVKVEQAVAAFSAAEAEAADDSSFSNFNSFSSNSSLHLPPALSKLMGSFRDLAAASKTIAGDVFGKG